MSRHIHVHLPAMDRANRRFRDDTKEITRAELNRKLKDGVWEAESDEHRGEQEIRDTKTGRRFRVRISG